MKFNHAFCTLFLLLCAVFTTSSLTAQETAKSFEGIQVDTSFSERLAVIKIIQDFYIGDHTGSIEHKRRSMHEKGAYRYINREGEYAEYQFDLNSDDKDTSFEEELLSVEIYDKLAVARIRQVREGRDTPEYKLMVLHKAKGQWKITSISWGFGVIH